MGNSKNKNRGRPSKGRTVRGNSLRQKRKSTGNGLSALFERHRLDQELAVQVLKGEHKPNGLKPNEIRNLQEALRQLGVSPDCE